MKLIIFFFLATTILAQVNWDSIACETTKEMEVFVPTKREKLDEMSHKKLEKKADEAFSDYIRLSYSNENGIVSCSTCDFRDLWKYLDNGHYRSRDARSTRWYEKNCSPQCRACNKEGRGGGKGEKVKHAEFIDKTHGEGTADELIKLSHEVKIFNRVDLIAIILHYRLKVKELLKQKGL